MRTPVPSDAGHNTVSSDENPQPENKFTTRKRWLFRLGAVVLGLSLVLLLEVSCRLLGWGNPVAFDDPFVGFSEVYPLFEKQGDRYQVVPSRRKFFANDSFPAEKPADGYRIFCLGGSTVQGRPYSIETAFGTWLELALQADDPRREWNVINCGGISYASYRLVPILEECLTYEPDLMILCTGHNEFLEDRSYDHIKHETGFRRKTMEALSRSHLFTLFRQAFHGEQSSEEEEIDKPMLPGEVDAMLDYHDSLALYHRDDEWRARIVEHYEFNLRRMIGLCRQAGVPIVLVRPPVNLAGTPPFKSEASQSLTDSQLEELQSLMNSARENYRDDLNASIRFLEAAVEMDPRFALAWYELGQCYFTRHRTDEAREAFLRARDEDVCPLRIVSEQEAALLKVAAEENVPLVDAYLLFEQHSDSGILDDQLLADHVHPTVFGHQLLASKLFEKLTELGITEPPEELSNRQNAWKEHHNSLDNHYFLQGQETLKALQGWTQGRAVGPPAAERFPDRLKPGKTGKE
jgi:lysophospholipase L1-like esterase